jgi:5-methylcytosine-specific restriction protein A
MARPGSPCVAGCPNLQPCPTHPPRRYSWTQEQPRIRGRRLQEARERLFLREPRCRQCRRVLTLDTMTRDHIVPLAEGGEDIESNTQPLCQTCNRVKTHAESERAKQRAGGVSRC